MKAIYKDIISSSVATVAGAAAFVKPLVLGYTSKAAVSRVVLTVAGRAIATPIAAGSVATTAIVVSPVIVSVIVGGAVWYASQKALESLGE
jgi:hypothetical protein